jgi:competence protein CoiA
MLTALNKYQQLITLIRHSDEEVAGLKSSKFYCPVCKAPLIIKAGKIKIPHFAHVSNIGCKGSGEPETAIHLRGKKLLFHHFSSLISTVELEHYLPSVQQRPDVYILLKDKRYSVEFQCAAISSDEFLARTIGYQNAGIEPVWILGSRIDQKGTGPRISLTHSQQHFIRYSPHAGYWLSYFDSENEMMHFYYNLHPHSAKLFSSETFTVTLASVPFPFKLPLKMNNPPNKYFKASNDSWIKNKLMYNNGVNDRFLKALYLNGDHLLSLPDYIGIPTEHMLLFKSHPIEWQYFIWYDGFKKKPAGSRVSFGDIFNSFQKRISTGFIQCRILPLVKEDLLVEALKEYLMILLKRDIIKEIKSEVYYVTGNHTK